MPIGKTFRMEGVMDIKIYDYLNKDAEWIRQKVFVEEQKFQQEFDDIDKTARHLVMYEDNQPVAVCRFFANEESQVYTLGRIAVMPEYRSNGTGRRLVEEAENAIRELGGRKIVLSAQLRAKGFYDKLGYVSDGEAHFEEYCPHVMMKKDLY